MGQKGANFQEKKFVVLLEQIVQTRDALCVARRRLDVMQAGSRRLPRHHNATFTWLERLPVFCSVPQSLLNGSGYIKSSEWLILPAGTTVHEPSQAARVKACHASNAISHVLIHKSSIRCLEHNVAHFVMYFLAMFMRRGVTIGATVL